MRTFSFIAAACLALATLPAFATPRTWSDNTGKFSVVGELVDLDAENIRIKKADGRVITVPRRLLSKADRDHLKRTASEGPTRPQKAPANNLAGVAQKDTLALRTGKYALAAGLQRKSLLLENDQLTILGQDGCTPIASYKLDHPYRFIAEREKYYVGIQDKPLSLNLLDKSTLKVTKKVPLSFLDATDLAIHPSLPISYVAIKKRIRVPRYQIAVVQESTGTVSEPRQALGRFVRVDPAGRYIIAGFEDIYPAKNDRAVRWDAIELIPQKYDDVSCMISYSLDAKGTPRLRQYIRTVSANPRGVRLSSDGRRATFCSVAGYPIYSKNLVSWDPVNLKKSPISYQLKRVATPEDLVYHPTLPLCASPSGGGAILFHRDTGNQTDDRLKNAKSIVNGDKVHRAFFSPDGQNLILHCESKEKKHELRKIALKLSAAAQLKTRQRVSIDRSPLPVMTAPATPPRMVGPSDQAVAWVAANNVDGASSPIVETARKKLALLTDVDQGFIYGLGEDWTKSHKSTVLIGHGTDLIIKELSPQEAKLLDIIKHYSTFTGGGRVPSAGARKVAIRTAKLETPKVGSDGQLSLQVEYEETVHHTGKGLYAVRVICRTATTELTLYHHLGTLIPAAKGKLSCKFKAPKSMVTANAVIAVVELVTFTSEPRRSPAHAVSNPVAVIIPGNPPK